MAGPLVVVLIFAVAAWLLYREIQRYHFRDIRAALSAMPAGSVWLAVGLTAVNYLLLIVYDVLAVRSIRHPLSLRRISLASFTGFVISYNFGSLLGGTSVRYRLYSAWGLSTIDIMRLVLMLGLTFWLGFFALAGVLFLLDPFPIPQSLGLPFETTQPLGIVLAGIALAYVAFTGLWKKPIRVRDTEIALPGLGVTVLQLATAGVDLMVAAAGLYVLLPAGFDMSYFDFLGIYVLAVVAVIVTHVPGGVGVFELLVLKMAAAQSSEDVVAALLVFRVVYYLLPLLVAFVLLAGHEIMLQRMSANRALADVRRAAGAVAPTLLALATFAAGAVLLFSGALPVLHSRVGPLERSVPLPLVEVSHFFGTLAGVGLVLIAHGLQRRLASAWRLAVGLLGAGIVLSLLKGLNVEEAILLALVLSVLVAFRRRFYRRGSLIDERLTEGWLVAVVLAVLCPLWLGLFVYRHVDYSANLWWEFAYRGDASRFLRASGSAVAVVLIFALRKRGRYQPEPTAPDEAVLDGVASIVHAMPRTAGNLALLGDKMFLFNKARTAFVMYARQRRSWIALGDPVGPDEEQDELVWSFLALVDRFNGWPVFYQVDADRLTVYLDQGLTLLKVGEEARVPLADFGLDGCRREGLRQAMSQLQTEQCVFEVVPQGDVAALLPELKAISDGWLAGKQIAEKGFSLGFFDARYLKRFPCAVIRKKDQIIAFANLWEGAAKEELSVDLVRCLPESPSCLMEYLFVELMLWGRQEGYQAFNLGIAPLSGLEDRPLAPFWNRAAAWMFPHGDHFANFQGLRDFKDRFDPIWKPKYLASPGGLALPRILTSLTDLIARTRITRRAAGRSSRRRKPGPS